jgi:hypothetical protein
MIGEESREQNFYYPLPSAKIEYEPALAFLFQPSIEKFQTEIEQFLHRKQMIPR